MSNNGTPKPPPNHPQPIAQIHITAMSDGSTNITGFPTTFAVATKIMRAATDAVINHFFKEAMAGNLDENGTIIPSKIVTPNKKLVDGNGRPLQ